jgi:hypothetical protein
MRYYKRNFNGRIMRWYDDEGWAIVSEKAVPKVVLEAMDIFPNPIYGWEELPDVENLYWALENAKGVPEVKVLLKTYYRNTNLSFISYCPGVYT